jgi:hypothetical protein
MTDFQYDVFVSHSSKDKSMVRPIAERLRSDGLKVWFDEWEIQVGDNIPAKLEEGLEHSNILLLCMSANAYGSEWAQLESGTFRFRDPLNKARRLIPLRLDEAPVKGSLRQFLYIKWQPDASEQSYMKLFSACTNRPPTAPANLERPAKRIKERPLSEAKTIRIAHHGVGDIVVGNKIERGRTVRFTPGPEHITPQTARALSALVTEIVERLTISGGDVGRAFRTVWGDFNAQFGLTTYKELPRDRAEEGLSYLQQWRASKNSKLRRSDPDKFRTSQLKGVWPRSKSLGFTNDQLYSFAHQKLNLKRPISSLNELGNSQLERLNRSLRYEIMKQSRRR